MSKTPLKRYSRTKKFEGYCFKIVVDDVLWPHGKRLKRDLILHNGISVMLPELDKNHLILIRQYRYGATQHLWEIPAGTIGKGESPLACAKREIIEEIGYRAKNWEVLTSFYASPGFSTEIIHSFTAKNLIHTGAALEDDEIIEPKVFSIKQVRDMLLKKQIRDAKSIVPLFYYLAKRKAL